MKKIISTLGIIALTISATSASFMFQEIDPICSISGKTHTSFPGEISDTSSWSIPKAYDGKCDVSFELTQAKKDVVYGLMIDFFEKRNYSSNNTLNTAGQKFVKDRLFPAIQKFIEIERNKETVNTKHIALVNAMVQTIGYDYYLQEIQ